jgi:threonine dehydrogenase-like Zn-dependent dehydrogenase
MFDQPGRFASASLRVAVVGAGPVGLDAALACRTTAGT